MTCPKCGSDQIGCVDSRKRFDEIKRRRECRDCRYRFNTIEISEERMEALLVTEEGNLELLDALKYIAEILKKEGVV